ncbi:MAG TPA: Xaa-Pro peptidase family protein [Eoetvoesiella sp.]
MSMPKEECLARITKVRNEMKSHGLDGLVVTDPTSFYYFTGQKIGKEAIGRPSIFILPLQGEPAVVDWSGPGTFARLYHRPYPTWIEDRRIYPETPFTHEEPTDWGVRDILVERGLGNGLIGIELGNEPRLNLGLNDFEKLKSELPAVRWIDSGPVVWPCRMIKSEWEITKLKTACQIGAVAWKQCLEGLEIGVTQAAIQRTILAAYNELGADIDSSAPLVLGATGVGGAFQEGDILYLDGGCSVNGYRMDFTRRAVFGQPSARQLAEHNGMWELLFNVMERIRPGVSTAEIFQYSQSLLAKTSWTNYSDHPAKRIGHGIGLVNEPPYLNAFDHHVIQEGMSITPEPKIETQEGLLNAEEHVVIRDNGCEVISDQLEWQLFRVT